MTMEDKVRSMLDDDQGAVFTDALIQSRYAALKEIVEAEIPFRVAALAAWQKGYGELATRLWTTVRIDVDAARRNEAMDHLRGIIGKIWEIVADGIRAADPDADPEYDVNNLYEEVRAGVEAKRKLAELDL